MIPDSDYVQEMDAFNMVPEGVSVHFTRIPLPQPYTPDAIMDLKRHVEKSAGLFRSLDARVIVFGCTAGSFIGGRGYNKDLIGKIETVSGTKATTTSSSVIAALSALRLKNLSVLAPYLDTVTERLKIFLEENGLKVRKIKSLNLDSDLKITLVHPEEIYRHGMSLDSTDTDGLFISCTTFRATAAIDILEQDMGKPVITSNQATIWNALRMADIRDKIDDYGMLLREL
jgi:maleate isomerase